MKKPLLLLFVFFTFQDSSAQTLQDTLAKIESVFTRYTAQTPGCQLAVARHGKIIFSKAWGMADLEHGVPLTTTSIIEAGSVSKQFTAAAILLLEQQGRLSLEDDVRKHVPELPDYGRTIRLRHLLHHTSGIKDWGAVAVLTGWPRSRKFYTNDDALEFIVHQKSLNNQPGDEYIYSNSNYNLLAIIVQRVSGLTLADYTRKHIFEPAGMANTQWRDNPNRIVANRAIAYEKVNKVFETDMPNEYVYGNGGLLTTTEDLVKWQEFYLRGKMGTSSLLAKQTQTEPLTRGATNEYGAALFIRKVSGQDNLSHGGATAGYRAYLEVFPKSGLAIALLSNTSEYDISSLATSVRNVFVEKQPAETAKASAAVKLTEAKLNSYTGWYKNSRDGAGMQLAVKDGELLANNKSKLLPLSETRFGTNNSFFFEMDGPKGLRFITPNSDTISYLKVAAPLASDKYVAYLGKYCSTETNSFITVFQKGDKLTISFKPHEEAELTPAYRDGFSIPAMGASMYFAKKIKNEITLNISTARARNVEFVKVQAQK